MWVGVWWAGRIRKCYDSWSQNNIDLAENSLNPGHATNLLGNIGESPSSLGARVLPIYSLVCIPVLIVYTLEIHNKNSFSFSVDTPSHKCMRKLCSNQSFAKSLHYGHGLLKASTREISPQSGNGMCAGACRQNSHTPAGAGSYKHTRLLLSLLKRYRYTYINFF